MIQSLARCALVAAAVAFGGAPAGAQLAAGAEVSLDSILNTSISAASKYSQRSNAAPASITIVNADDIRAHGYRNLQEVLESVRGFYVTNDRNYPYLGTRGFSRTADYNSRVLMLVDGHSLNEQVWGGTPVGTDLPFNLDAVERVEIVQGPGSALYGTGAVFAVINIVTKTALALDGGVARVNVGSGGERSTALAAGHSFASGLTLSGSGLFTRTIGGDHYFPEFDSPSTLNGLARGLDWERAIGGYGQLAWRALSVRTGYRSRAKGIPTASFGMVFGDARAETVDENLWVDASVTREWGGVFTFSGRLFADRFRYRGVLPFDARPSAYSDAGASTALGSELMLHWAPLSRLRLTVGSEGRAVTRVSYSDQDEVGVASAANVPYQVVSAFTQGELQLHARALIVAGVRNDHYSRSGNAITPRFGLILSPDASTTVKLLYGEAFRAPSAVEALLTVGIYKSNPTLRPERVATSEINVQRRIGDVVLLGLSAYQYDLNDLIDEAPLDVATVSFKNISRAKARGLELEVDARGVGPLSTRFTYALQKATDAEDMELTNSPRHVASLGGTLHGESGLRAATQLRYESGRRTILGSTAGFLRTDANAGYRPRTGRGALDMAELSLRVTNLFDTAYSNPAGSNNSLDSIAADRRTYALQLSWHF